MNRRLLLSVQVILLVLAGTAAGAVAGRIVPLQRAPGLAVGPLTALGSGFAYQALLTDGGNLANGQYDFTFALFDATSGGNQIGTTRTLTNQTVSNGLFVVTLDFGNNAFLGDARYLEIAAQ